MNHREWKKVLTVLPGRTDAVRVNGDASQHPTPIVLVDARKIAELDAASVGNFADAIPVAEPVASWSLADTAVHVTASHVDELSQKGARVRVSV